MQDQDIRIEDLTVFIDPVDGTKSFINNNLSNVSNLIGVVHDNKPLFGVVNWLFAEEPCIYFGGPLTGLFTMKN